MKCVSGRTTEDDVNVYTRPTEDDVNVYTHPNREEIDMTPAVYDNITADPTYVTILEP